MTSMTAELSSSPNSLINYFEEGSTPLSLEQFLQKLPVTIESTLKNNNDSLEPCKGCPDPVGELFSRLNVNMENLARFAHVDPSKNYTRNLVATDDKHYTLLLLCWNPGKESPVHDHPCDGCWMQVCRGSIQECRYEKRGEEMKCFSDEVYVEGQFAYITDSMGYHKIGNPSVTQLGMTLHLYCPPFSKCKIWLDTSRASEPSCSSVCYHSEYGTIVSNVKKTEPTRT